MRVWACSENGPGALFLHCCLESFFLLFPWPFPSIQWPKTQKRQMSLSSVCGLCPWLSKDGFMTPPCRHSCFASGRARGLLGCYGPCGEHPAHSRCFHPASISVGVLQLLRALPYLFTFHLPARLRSSLQPSPAQLLSVRCWQGSSVFNQGLFWPRRPDESARGIASICLGSMRAWFCYISDGNGPPSCCRKTLGHTDASLKP